jgi:glycosyltransferase involved in cell wall biosynthesis
MWGHFVDRCGSVRPKQLQGGFQRVWQEQRVLPHQSCIAISAFTRAQMLRSGYQSSNITVVHNPAPAPCPETAVASTRPGPPHFLFLGRIATGKGLEWLIQAVKRVRVDAHFEIIGDGSEKMRLLQLSRSLGIAERFTWSGWISDEREIFARLAASRAVVFPSLWQEPAGLVTLESAASGRALIASRVGGIPEYAEKLGHALLVSPNDVEGLAEAITRLAEDVELSARLGREAWLRLRSGVLSLDGHLNELDAVYARALQGVSTPVEVTS